MGLITVSKEMPIGIGKVIVVIISGNPHNKKESHLIAIN
jgi:hypothetical protein